MYQMKTERLRRKWGVGTIRDRANNEGKELKRNKWYSRMKKT